MVHWNLSAPRRGLILGIKKMQPLSSQRLSVKLSTGGGSLERAQLGSELQDLAVKYAAQRLQEDWD